MKSLNPYLLLLAAILFGCNAKETSVITIDLKGEGAEISKDMYGIFYEEINRAGDGGLYPEMIYNRAFEEKNIPETMTYKDGFIYAPSLPNYGRVGRDGQNMVSNWRTPYDADNKADGWILKSQNNQDAFMKVVEDKPYLDPATPHSLKIELKKNVGNITLENEGFKGIALKEGDKYDLLFYLRSPKTYFGSITASLVDRDNQIVTEKTFDVKNDGKWNAYNFSFESSKTDNQAKLVLSFTKPGMLWMDYISLLPEKTFKNHGLRQDIAQILADIKPGFIRWPGGCIVEGCTMDNRVKWWESIGPHLSRTGQYDLWGYFNSYGFGYHEFLQFCEDIGAQGMYVANAGVSCSIRNGDFFSMDEMPVIVKQILDAIEYAIGDTNTEWGKKRAENGHPEPFPLKYIEIGNENTGPVFGERYNMIYTAIKEKYPQLHLLNSHFFLTSKIPNDYDKDKVDMIDPHWYVNDDYFYANTHIFDTVPRGQFDIYVGEYACNRDVGTGNLKAALSEAAFMTGMERNADIVKMCSYAPLLENVNYLNWPTNLIRFKNDSVFGRSSYYVQKMFAENRPDVNLNTVMNWIPPEERIEGGVGFSTFSEVQVKNIHLHDGNKLVYSSTFPEDTAKWNVNSGNWIIAEEGVYASKNLDSDDRDAGPQDWHRRFQYHSTRLKDAQFENLTLDAQIYRDSMFNGINIMVGMKDDGSSFQISVAPQRRGPFGRRDEPNNAKVNATLSMVNGGSDDSPRFFGNAVQLGSFGESFDFDPMKWHDIEVSVEGKMISLIIDGDLIGEIEYKRPQRQFAIAGYDRESEEIIVKVVNGEGTPFNTVINLNNTATIDPNGQIIELYSESNEDENSFKDPMKISPQVSTYDNFKSSFAMEFKPYSFTVLKIKAK